jgi:hypothetical protein
MQVRHGNDSQSLYLSRLRKSYRYLLQVNQLYSIEFLTGKKMTTWSIQKSVQATEMLARVQ